MTSAATTGAFVGDVAGVFEIEAVRSAEIRSCERFAKKSALD
jgi:hypothetical protein